MKKLLAILIIFNIYYSSNTFATKMIYINEQVIEFKNEWEIIKDKEWRELNINVLDRCYIEISDDYKFGLKLIFNDIWKEILNNISSNNEWKEIDLYSNNNKFRSSYFTWPISNWEIYILWGFSYSELEEISKRINNEITKRIINNDIYIKLDSAKSELLKINKWIEYISKINKLVLDLSDSKLEELDIKLDQLNIKLKRINSNSNKYKKYKIIIEYFRTKILEKLFLKNSEIEYEYINI